MNANQLRASILQMAIEGKLVPQLDSEEPAIHILERICKKRKIKLTTINNSINDHDLPNGWTKCLIGELLELKAGKFIKGSSIACNPSKENSFPCYGGNGIRGFVENFNRDGLYPIIGRQGALCGNLKLANGKFYATEHAVVVDCLDEVDAKWCFYTLTQLNLNKYATATAQPGLAVKTINGLQITVPPLEEQKRIVAKLEQLLPLVDEYGKAYEKLEELNAEFPDKLKASVLQSAIKGQLVPQLDSEPAVEQIGKGPKDVPFEIPEKWKWVSIDSSIKIVRGGSPRPIKKFLTDSPDGINWIKIGDADKGKSLINSTKERIVPEGVNKSRFVKKGSLLLTNSMSFGYPYILNIDGCIHDGWLALFDFEQYLFRDYLFYVLLSPYMRSSFVNKAVGTGVKNLNIDRVRSLFIPIPSLEEQKRIVAKVEELFALIDAMKK